VRTRCDSLGLRSLADLWPPREDLVILEDDVPGVFGWSWTGMHVNDFLGNAMLRKGKVICRAHEEYG
jgi:hypothetical protein